MLTWNKPSKNILVIITMCNIWHVYPRGRFLTVHVAFLLIENTVHWNNLHCCQIFIADSKLLWAPPNIDIYNPINDLERILALIVPSADNSAVVPSWKKDKTTQIIVTGVSRYAESKSGFYFWLTLSFQEVMAIFFPIVFMAVFRKWPSIRVKLAMLWDFLDNKRNSTFLCFTFTEFTVANSLAKDANCNLGMKRQWQSANTQNPNRKNALPNPKTPTPKPQTQKSVAFYTSAYNSLWHNGYHKLHISCNSH